MKHTLKTFPRPQMDKFGDSEPLVCYEQWEDDVKNWHVGLMEELRQRKQRYYDLIQGVATQQNKEILMGKINEIDELLGESTK